MHAHTSTARADFSIKMGCTPETGNRHSVCTLWLILTKVYLLLFSLFEKHKRVFYCPVVPGILPGKETGVGAAGGNAICFIDEGRLR